jgi:chemotaxis protein CheX
MEPNMYQDNDDCVTIAQSVFSMMLNMEVVPCETQLGEKRPDRVSGCVQISGAWQGAVVLQTSVAMATKAARRMLNIPSGDVSEADIKDALAELTNMIGGNMKSLVPGPSFLSLPSVTTGRDFDFEVSGAKLIGDVSLNCGGEPIRVLKCGRQS